MDRLSATLGAHPEISRLRFMFENVTVESSHSPYHPSFDPWSFVAANEELQNEIDELAAAVVPRRELYAGQFEAFHAALASGEELPVGLGDARASLELLTAIYHSAQTGNAVDLPIGPDHPGFAGWLPGDVGP